MNSHDSGVSAAPIQASPQDAPFFSKALRPPNSHDNGLSNVKTLLTRCANDSTHLSLTVVSCFAGGTSKTAVDRPTTYYKR